MSSGGMRGVNRPSPFPRPHTTIPHKQIALHPRAPAAPRQLHQSGAPHQQAAVRCAVCRQAAVSCRRRMKETCCQSVTAAVLWLRGEVVVHSSNHSSPSVTVAVALVVLMCRVVGLTAWLARRQRWCQSRLLPMQRRQPHPPVPLPPAGLVALMSAAVLAAWQTAGV